MARFSANDADNYGGSGSSFFSLKNDGDTARVRFMYNDMEDVEGYAVHEVHDGDNRRYVNCLREYNEPKDKCPFCAAGYNQIAKLYIPLYDVDEGEVKIWERGKQFFNKIGGICARYTNSDTPLVAHTFDVERHGKKGDTSTTYELYETGNDDTCLEDLPEAPEVLGSIILDKTAEEMEDFLEYGEFPANGAPNRSTNNSRGSRDSRDADDTPSRPTGRRTPSRSSAHTDSESNGGRGRGRGRGDRF